MNVVQEAKYIMSNVEGNNNKYWYIFRYDDNSCITKNGRVGAAKGDEHNFQHDDEAAAIKFFNAKCKEKERKGYKKLDVITTGSVVTKNISVNESLVDVAKKQIEHNSTITSKLIEKLSKANIHNILESTTMQYSVDTGLFSTPCGIVTQDTLDKARDLLIVMSDYVKNSDLRNKKYITSLEDYLMLIPQKVGRKLDPETLYTSLSDIRKQNDTLDSLEASLDAAVKNEKDGTSIVIEQKLFSCKLLTLDDNRIYDRITKKINNTMDKNHACSHLKIKEIYTIDINTMKEQFEKNGSKVGNINEFFHGTRISNVLSILKSGLVIPSSSASHVNGRLYGNGLYFAPKCSKSLNYSYGYWDNGKKDNNCFLFLADVSMGNCYVPSGKYGSYPVKGYDSTWAKAGKSGVINDECIVYKLNQCNLTYLVEFSENGK